MAGIFVAYASSTDFHHGILENACQAASTNDRVITAWSQKDTSGSPIARSVEGWIETADGFVADISKVNANVTYELGYAIGLGKPIRLIRSAHIPFEQVKEVGLLNTLGHDDYSFEPTLTKILEKKIDTGRWTPTSKNKDQPIFVLQPPQSTEVASRTLSAIKKLARVRFRSFNPAEVSRLNAEEAYQHAVSSFGVVTFWLAGEGADAVRNNQRASFVYGVARGAGIPALLIAEDSQDLPLDLQDQADRWKRFPDIDRIIQDFRLSVADAQNDFVSFDRTDQGLLDHLNCGDPVAENEASTLAEHFLKTNAFNKTLSGQANILVGRKGSGKTAVFLQVRDKSRVDKQNIIIDLMPDGHQLIKMKEFILDELSFGARKEVIAAFWEYVLWLEIAYKILEKDDFRAMRDHRLFERYEKLKTAFLKRVDTGRGDFSERLKKLADNVVDRFHRADLGRDGLHQIDSSKVLEVIYGEDVRTLRDEVLDYLQLKGFVFLLFDNLDRFWTPGGFTEDDALIVVGLAESMQEIGRKFRKQRLEFRWAIFIRSDVYEFLISGMADYGKLAVESIEWSDRALLKALFEERLKASVPDNTKPWPQVWSKASVATVSGEPVLDFLIHGSLMRPRYLIRLFETARRRAITFGRDQISEDDYQVALTELGWQVLEDLDREISDLVSNSDDFLFEIAENRDELSVSKFRYLAGKRLKSEEDVERLLDVMIWNGSLGVMQKKGVKYIFDTGYKRQYLSSLINSDETMKLVLHPTLVAAVA